MTILKVYHMWGAKNTPLNANQYINIICQHIIHSNVIYHHIQKLRIVIVFKWLHRILTCSTDLNTICFCNFRFCPESYITCRFDYLIIIFLIYYFTYSPQQARDLATDSTNCYSQFLYAHFKYIFQHSNVR